MIFLWKASGYKRGFTIMNSKMLMSFVEQIQYWENIGYHILQSRSYDCNKNYLYIYKQLLLMSNAWDIPYWNFDASDSKQMNFAFINLFLMLFMSIKNETCTNKYVLHKMWWHISSPSYHYVQSMSSFISSCQIPTRFPTHPFCLVRWSVPHYTEVNSISGIIMAWQLVPPCKDK